MCTYPPKIAVSFDRITVVGNLIPAREKRLKKHVETNIRINLRDTGFDRFKCQALENKVYVEYNRKQAQAMGRSEIRVEFNPNELNDEEMEFVQFIFLDNMRNKDFSRIDLAFDLEMDLSDYLVMSDKSIKKTIFTDEQIIQKQNILVYVIVKGISEFMIRKSS